MCLNHRPRYEKFKYFARMEIGVPIRYDVSILLEYRDVRFSEI